MSHLRNVIAEAIWRRVTADDGSTKWADLFPVDREEFEADADAVLDDLSDKGLLVAGPYGVSVETTPPPVDTKAVAIDIVARGIIHRIVAAEEDFDLWGEYPLIGEHDWTAVVDRVGEHTEAANPGTKAMLDAYEYLANKAEGTPGTPRTWSDGSAVDPAELDQQAEVTP